MSSRRAGYEAPNFTPIPNPFFDEDLDRIATVAEAKVMLFIFRQTFGWQKSQDAISLRQISQGITRKDGTHRKGAGLPKSTICRALAALERKGFLRRERRQDGKRGNVETLYTPIRTPCPTDETRGETNGEAPLVPPTGQASAANGTSLVPPVGHTKETSSKEMFQKKSIDLPILDFDQKKELLLQFIEGHPDYPRLAKQFTHQKAAYALGPTARYSYEATFRLLKDRAPNWGPQSRSQRPRDWSWFETVFRNHIHEFGEPVQEPEAKPVDRAEWEELLRKTKVP